MYYGWGGVCFGLVDFKYSGCGRPGGGGGYVVGLISSLKKEDRMMEDGCCLEAVPCRWSVLGGRGAVEVK